MLCPDSSSNSFPPSQFLLLCLPRTLPQQEADWGAAQNRCDVAAVLAGECTNGHLIYLAAPDADAAAALSPAEHRAGAAHVALVVTASPTPAPLQALVRGLRGAGVPVLGLCASGPDRGPSPSPETSVSQGPAASAVPNAPPPRASPTNDAAPLAPSVAPDPHRRVRPECGFVLPFRPKLVLLGTSYADSAALQDTLADVDALACVLRAELARADAAGPAWAPLPPAQQAQVAAEGRARVPPGSHWAPAFQDRLRARAVSGGGAGRYVAQLLLELLALGAGLAMEAYEDQCQELLTALMGQGVVDADSPAMAELARRILSVRRPPAAVCRAGRVLGPAEMCDALLQLVDAYWTAMNDMIQIAVVVQVQAPRTSGHASINKTGLCSTARPGSQPIAVGG